MRCRMISIETLHHAHADHPRTGALPFLRCRPRCFAPCGIVKDGRRPVGRNSRLAFIFRHGYSRRQEGGQYGKKNGYGSFRSMVMLTDGAGLSSSSRAPASGAVITTYYTDGYADSGVRVLLTRAYGSKPASLRCVTLITIMRDGGLLSHAMAARQ